MVSITAHSNCGGVRRSDVCCRHDENLQPRSENRVFDFGGGWVWSFGIRVRAQILQTFGGTFARRRIILETNRAGEFADCRRR